MQENLGEVFSLIMSGTHILEINQSVLCSFLPLSICPGVRLTWI